jgi:hypothetical protein
MRVLRARHVAARLRVWLLRARLRPLPALSWAVALATTIYVIGGPLWVARYPLMTDLPMHAAKAAVFRHYFDSSWHFHEQFTFQPLAVPYLLFYVLAALFMLVLPTMAAVKCAVAAMLALLPTGLAVLFWGMKKSPALGLVGLLFAWGSLSSWGFMNFVGALGVWAMVVGMALRVADEPRPGRVAGLAGLVVLLFFTHPFRFPLAVGAVVLVAAGARLLGRRAAPFLPALGVAASLSLAFWLSRPADMLSEPVPFALDWARLGFDAFGEHPYLSLRDPREGDAFVGATRGVLALAALLAARALLESRGTSARRRHAALGLSAVALSALGALALYLTLPMEIGEWWFVYPRESTAAAYIALALIPNLPRRAWLRLAAVGWLALSLVPLGRVAIDNHRDFDAASDDFARVSEAIPRAPRLLYLVFDHSGTRALHSPFMHLPGYVQAEKGGWLSFSFAWLGHSPLKFRPPYEPGAEVPPRPPPRWEWTPERFDLFEDGDFYDWFLVRSKVSPQSRFARDARIRLVTHEGTWWLYCRKRPGESACPEG